MKTVIFFDSGDYEIKIYLVDGDHRDLDDVYINAIGPDEITKQDRLSHLVWDKEGQTIIPEITKEQATQEIRNGAEFIICGMIM